MHENPGEDATCSEWASRAWAAVKFKHHFEKIAYYRLVLTAFAHQMLGPPTEDDPTQDEGNLDQTEYKRVEDVFDECRKFLNAHEVEKGCKAYESAKEISIHKPQKLTKSPATLCYGAREPSGSSESDSEQLLPGGKETSIVIKPLRLKWEHRAEKGLSRAKEFKESTEKNAKKLKKRAVPLRKDWDEAKAKLETTKKLLDEIAPPAWIQRAG